MPDRSLLAVSTQFLTAVLLAMVAVLPASLAARDDIEYGRYLGTRLRMYEEAYAILDKAIATSSGAQKARARQTKAEVVKAEADVIFSVDNDADARMKRYKNAIDVFGEVTEPEAVRAKGEMMLDIAKELTRTAPEQARTYCDDAAKFLDATRKELDKQRGPNSTVAEVYNAVYFQYCRNFYIKALSYPAGSQERERELKFTEKWIGEFDFDRMGVTRDFVLCYELRGDVELARNNVENAVKQFLSLVSFLEDSTPNAFVGNIALQHGYLRAVELITTELDYDPARLQQVIDLHAEAYARYGAFNSIDYLLKRFELFRISALIKQGRAENIRGAVDALLKLAASRDPVFRRSAVTVLADVASRPELSDELRFTCAETVYGEVVNNPYPVILKNIQAYQSILVACSDQKKFETYAPACFTRMADMYDRVWRFMEAAMVCKEAAYRTAYFRDKFSGAKEVPEHMRDRCSMIQDVKSLEAFPGEMASMAAKYGGFLVRNGVGDPNNRELDRLRQELDKLKAAFGPESAQYDLIFNKAYELYSQKRYPQAAAKCLNLPSTYKKYHLAVYIAAKAYYAQTSNIQAPRASVAGLEDERETPEFFRLQQERHAADFSSLPESMWKGIEVEHFKAINDASLQPSLVNWHKAVYVYKKYFLLEVRRAWTEIEPLLEGTENPTLVDAIVALAQLRNTKWLAENPTGKGSPDTEMARMGSAAYELAFLLRNPPDNIDKQLQDAIKASERGMALGLLRPYWSMFGNHMVDSPQYNRASQSMAFSALYEAGDTDACEKLYLTYKESFPEEQNNIKGMVQALYSMVLRDNQDRAQALVALSVNLDSRSAVLEKNTFERIKKEFEDPKLTQRAQEDQKKLAEAKTRVAQQKVLADHFWDVWMVELTFNRNRDAMPEYFAEIQAKIEARWKEMEKEYPKRWGEAVRAELEAALKQGNYAPIKALAEQAGKGDPLLILGQLEEASTKASGDQQQLMLQLVTAIKLNTDELQWFVGAVFIYEFGGFLEQVAAEVVDRARPMFARVLKYFEEYRISKGAKGLGDLSESEKYNTGKYYFMIRDWKNAVRYLEVVEQEQKSKWGSVELVPADSKIKRVGRDGSDKELEVRYWLGKSYLELYRQNGDKDMLVKAALQLRRCMSFNEVRDTLTLARQIDAWKMVFQKEMELYYVAAAQAMAECYVALHKEKDIKIDWPKYISQQTATLEPKKDNGKDVLQPTPEDHPGYLWFAAQSRLKIWASFSQLPAYQYRTEYRDNLIGWLELMIEWKATYGDKTTPKGVDARTISQMIKEAGDIAKRESEFNAAYMSEDTRAYVATMKKLSDRLNK